MDAIYNILLDQLSLEGPEGCDIATAWTLLHPRLDLECLDGPVKQQLWQRITEDPDLQVCKPRAQQTSSGEPGDRRAQPASELCLRDKQGLPWREAEEQQLLIVASEGLRNAALGIHDEALASSAISGIQRATLEIVARSRQHGALRNALCVAAGLAAKNFHYVIRQLECRGLVLQSPITTSQIGNTNFTNTTVVHLRRFAPSLLPGQYLKQAVGVAGTFTIDNDEERMVQVCQQLKQAPDETLLDGELKRCLGYRGLPGHRAWAKVRRKMVELDVLHVYLGALNGRPVTICKMLKPLQVAGKGRRGKKPMKDADHAEGDAEGLVASAQQIPLVAETGMEMQILRVLLNAGSVGVPVPKLMRMLGLDGKKYAKRMDVIASRLGLAQRDEQAGKIVMRHWTAPAAALQHHRAAQAPTPPSGGWLTAVQSAIEAGQDDMEAAEDPMQIIARDAAPNVTGPLAEPERSSAFSCWQPAAEQPAIAAAGHVPSEEGTSLVAYNGSAGTLVPQEVHSSGLKVIGPTRASRAALAQAEPGSTGAESSGKAGSRTAQERLQVLQNVLDREGWALVVDVFRMFQGQASSVGGKRSGPDKKTIDRIVQRCVDTGMAWSVDIELPAGTQWRKLHSRTAELLIKTGAELDDALLAKVCVALLREPSTAHPHPTRQARDMHRAGMSLPSAEGITRLKLTADQPEQQRQKQGQQSKDPPAHPLDRVANMRASASIMNRLVENGFYMHRLVRARLLHYFICELVGLAGHKAVSDPHKGQRPTEDAPRHAAPGPSQGPLFQLQLSLGPRPSGQPGQQPLPTQAALPWVATSEPPSLTFEMGFLWDSMPIDMFLQVIGSECEPAMVKELMSSCAPLGTLPEEQREQLVSEAARKRMASLLDVLKRMRLVTALVAGMEHSVKGLRRAELQGSALFAAEQHAQLEEPASAAGGGDGPVPAEGPSHWRDFDLSEQEELDQYWARLEFCATSRAEDFKRCFPCNCVTVLSHKFSWSTAMLLAPMQQEALKQRLAGQPVHKLNWEWCWKLSQEMHVPYVTLLRRVYALRTKTRLEHLRSGLPPLPQTEQASISRRLLLDTRTDAERLEQRKAVARNIYARRREERAALGQAHQAVERLAIPRLEGPTARISQHDLGYGPPDSSAREVKAARGSRLWAVHEDRFVLKCWCRWHANMGFELACFRMEMRALPAIDPVTERHARRRTVRLAVTEETRESMGKLRALITEAHEKAQKRNPTDTDSDTEAATASTTPEPDQPLLQAAANLAAIGSGGRVGEEVVQAMKRLQKRGSKAGQPLKRRAIEGADGTPQPASVAGEPRQPNAAAVVEEAMRTDPRYANFVATATDAEERLFDLLDGDDNSRHERCWSLIDAIIAHAPLRYLPEQYKPRKDKASKAGKAQAIRPLARKGRKQASTTTAAHLWKPGNGAVEDELAAEVEDGDGEPVEAEGEEFLQSELALQSLPQAWRHQIGRKVLWRKMPLPDTNHIPASVVTAMALIKGLLFAAEHSGSSPAGAAQALTSRFPQDDIIAAFGHLIRAGQVYNAQSPRPFHLSNRFYASLQAIGYPAALFRAAQAVHETLRLRLGPMDMPSSAGLPSTSAEPSSLAISPHEEIHHGMLPEALSLMLGGHVSLRSSRAEQDAEPGEEEQPSKLINILPVTIHISRSHGHAFGSDPASLAHEKVYCQDEAAYSSSPDRAAAMDSQASVSAVQTHEGLQALQAAGLHGLDVHQLAGRIIAAPDASQDAPKDGSTSPGEAEEVAQAVAEDLVQQGLAHRVQGAGSWSYVATEHAQAFYPASSAPPVGHRQIEQASALPWVDHQGQVQQELFTLLARRAISAAIRSPGLAEADMLKVLEAMTLLQAQALLECLLTQRLLKAVTAKVRQAGPPAIFGPAANTSQQVRHFFANPVRCFSCSLSPTAAV